MDIEKELSDRFKKIGVLCKDILVSQIPKLVNDENSDIVQKILKNKKELLNHDMIKTYVVRLFSTAFNCSKELDVAKRIVYNCISSSSCNPNPFFFERVWNGDVYLSKKMDALDDLIEELESTKNIVGDIQKFYWYVIDDC